jgi:hypothetical protein
MTPREKKRERSLRRAREALAVLGDRPEAEAARQIDRGFVLGGWIDQLDESVS